MPDYGRPTDANGDNHYELVVGVSDDQGYTTTKALMVRVVDDPSQGAMLLQVRALLQGAYRRPEALMADGLRLAGILPVTQPYGVAPFSYAGKEQINLDLVAVTGADAMVDWVLLELRSASDAAQVLAAKAVLVQRDGDLMDAATGESRLLFADVPPGQYYLALRHRNHLGVMTASPIQLKQGVVSIDFSDPATAVAGEHNRVMVDNKAMLWSGDLTHDHRLVLNGQGSDASHLLSRVLTDFTNLLFNSSYQVDGYLDTDLNMDGKTLFMGPANDANLLVGNVLTHPGNTGYVSNFIVQGGMALRP